MGFLDALKDVDSSAASFGETNTWRSVGIIENWAEEEPYVLQQLTKYPTSGMQTETTKPLNTHRIVPLSELLEE